MRFNSRGCHDIAIVGLDFYAHTMDPESPIFSEDKTYASVDLIMREGQVAERILIEDCRMRFCGMTFMRGKGRAEDLVFRRNLVLDRYSRTSHSQGMFASGVSILLEENVFDHNGWLIREQNNRKDRGGATIFNHNTYFSGCHDVTFRGNMFLRAASSGNKWTANHGKGSARNIVIDDNLYVEGEIGISMGGNNPGPLRFANIRITNNVMLDMGRGQPTLRTLGWYLDIMDWDGGLVAGNCFAHQASKDVSNVYAIHVGRHKGGNGVNGTSVHTRNVTVSDNVIHGLRSGAAAIIISQSDSLSDVLFSRNLVQPGGQTAGVLHLRDGLGGVVFQANVYDSGEGDWGRIGDSALGFDEWVVKSGETNAVSRMLRFPDPDRTVETYMATLGGEPTLDAFIAEARKQSKANWRKEFTASAVNAYVREGFGITPYVAPATRGLRSTGE